MYPFERFTEGAKKVLKLAQEEAERAHHSYIGTEHILLGLLREGQDNAARILASLEVTLERVRPMIESVLGRQEPIILQQVIPTSRVKAVIEIAFEEARQRGTASVGTEHLLLGLLIEGEGVAAHVLQNLGASRDRVEDELKILIQGTSAGRKRVIVLGGTRFIGRAIVSELVGQGYTVLVVHRGEHEPRDLASVEHLHTDRKNLQEVAPALKSFEPTAVIDACAMTRTDAEAALAALPSGLRMVVLSSQDVYRAFGAVLASSAADPVPIDETSALRADRYPYRGKREGMDHYDKLDVEEAYFVHQATVCRLPMVYGEHDYQRREEFILRRVRAGRPRIPIGPATWLWSRGYVGDLARGIRLALESKAAIGEAFNLSEAKTWSIGLWVRCILEAAGSQAELVRVSDETLLPDDLKITGSQAQHLLVSSAKARSKLRWDETDPIEAIRCSVRWHLEHPPEGADLDFTADDRALASAN